jgi:mannose-6-phosphate isomerase-like protein (cupin superfamily)
VEVLRFWEEEGVTVPEPYKRHIKVMLAPDRRNAPELTFSQVLIYPESKTDYHAHDRPELIVVVSGRGKSICDGKEIGVQADMALRIKPGEKHQLINDGDEMLKLYTFFTPAFSAHDLLSGIMKAAGKKE